MNRFFNAQNLPSSGIPVDVVFTSETTAKYLNRLTGAEITAQQAILNGSTYRVKPHFQIDQDESLTHYGNYQIAARDYQGLTLQLATRSLRILDGYNSSGKILDLQAPDIWNAAFRDGSPVYTIHISPSGMSLATLWDAGLETQEVYFFNNLDNTSENVTTLRNRAGEVIASSSSSAFRDAFDSMVLNTLKDVTGSRPGMGRARIEEQSTGGRVIGYPLHLALRAQYESVHWFGLTAVEGLLSDDDGVQTYGYEQEGPFYRVRKEGLHEVFEELFFPVPLWDPKGTWQDVVDKSLGYLDLDLVELGQGGIPATLVPTVDDGSWVKAVRVVNLDTQPILRLEFNPFGSAGLTQQCQISFRGRDYNRDAELVTRIQFSIKSI